MKFIFTLFSFLFLFGAAVQAQLAVKQNDRVVIGEDTLADPSGQFAIFNKFSPRTISVETERKPGYTGGLLGMYQYHREDVNDFTAIRNRLRAYSTSKIFGVRNVMTAGELAEAYGVFNDLSDITTGVKVGTYTILGSNAKMLASDDRMAGTEVIIRQQARDIAYGTRVELKNTGSRSTDETRGLSVRLPEGSNGDATTYGVYSSITGDDNYAGYFEGAVNITGDLTVGGMINNSSSFKSAGQLDTIVRALDLINTLIPRQRARTTSENRTSSLKNAEKNTQYGFITEEVARAFPDLIKTTLQPAVYGPSSEYDPNDTTQVIIPEIMLEPARENQQIRMLDLIPILTKAIQDQQSEITQLKNLLAKVVDLPLGLLDQKSGAPDSLAFTQYREETDLKIQQLREELADLKSCIDCQGVGLRPSPANIEYAVEKLSLYPNPATNQVTVNSGLQQAYTIEVVDATGRLFATVESSGPVTRVNTADWVPGTYHFRILREGVVAGEHSVVVHR